MNERCKPDQLVSKMATNEVLLDAVPGLAKKPSATTISTIAVHSKNTKIVVALLQSGTKFNLKLMELQPELADLGQDFHEASYLQACHHAALTSLQSKRSPVEELLRQADHQVAQQKTKAAIYSAMAESLGSAWRDLNFILDQRKLLLDQNYLFHQHYRDFIEKSNVLEALCKSAPDDLMEAQKSLNRLSSAKKCVLESCGYTLQEGECLLEKLHQLYALTDFNCKPQLMKQSISRAIEQVELWLESLHDRRIVVTLAFDQKKVALCSKLQENSVVHEVEALSDIVLRAKEQFMAYFDQLGQNASEVEERLLQVMKWQSQAAQIHQRCLACVQSPQCPVQAFTVLESSSDYLQLLESGTSLLTQAGSFFKELQNFGYLLDELETNLKHAGRQADKLTALKPAIQSLETIMNELTDRAQAFPQQESRGIQMALGQMKSRVDDVKATFCLADSQATKAGATLRNFQSKVTESKEWLRSVRSEYLSEQKQLLSLDQVAQSHGVYKELLNRMHIKSFELEGLLAALKTVADQCSNAETREVESTMRKMAVELDDMRSKLDQRIRIAEMYQKWLKLHQQIDVEFRQLESTDLNCASAADPAARIMIQQLYSQAEHVARNCKQDLGQLQDPTVLKEASLKQLDEMSLQLKSRYEALMECFSQKDKLINEGHKVDQEWSSLTKRAEDKMQDIQQMVNEMCPLLKPDLSPDKMLLRLEDKAVCWQKLKLSLDVASDILAQLASILAHIPKENKHQAELVWQKLSCQLNEFQERLDEDERLLDGMTSFFKKASNLNDSISNLIDQYKKGITPNDIVEAELMAKEHEAGKRCIEDQLSQLNADKAGLLDILEQCKKTPRCYTEQDAGAVMNVTANMKSLFEQHWLHRKDHLTKLAKYCLFSADISRMASRLDEVADDIRIQSDLQESLKSGSQVTLSHDSDSAGLTELRRALEELQQTQLGYLHQLSPNQAETLDLRLKQLQQKWLNIMQQVKERNDKFNLAKEYFQHLEKAEQFLTVANKKLLEWSRKMPTVADASEAEKLKEEIEHFVQTNKNVEKEILLRVSTSAGDLFGKSEAYGQLQTLQKEHDDTFDALSDLVLRLSNVTTEWRLAEAEEARKQRLQAEAEAELRAAKAEAEATRLAFQEAQQKAVRKLEAEVQTEDDDCSAEAPPRPPPPLMNDDDDLDHQMRPVAPLFTDYLTDMVLKEGEKCVLRAGISPHCHPTAKMTWFKDGVPISSNNLDYKTSYNPEHGTACLVIDEVFAEDSANWSVRAANSAGYAESHGKLTVKMVEPERSPRLVMPLAKQTPMNQGQDLELKVKLDAGHPVATVSWFKDDLCLDMSGRKYLSAQYPDTGMCVLKLVSKAELEDSGTYCLKAVNPHGSISSSTVVDVQPAAPVVHTELPVFDLPLTNLEANTGDEVVLCCQVSGVPGPDIQWFHNNRPIKRTHDLSIWYDHPEAVLKMKEVYPKAAGTYTCKASNVAGSASSTCILTVKVARPEASDSEAGTDKSLSKPAFYVPLRNQDCTEGEEVCLEVVVVGRPQPKVLWYRNNVPLQPTDQMEILHQGDTSRLILRNCVPDQCGEYKARAINIQGECSSTCMLAIHQQPPQQTAAIKPHFVKHLASPLVLDEGDPLRLEAVVQGNPVPQIKWYQGDQLLSRDSFQMDYIDDRQVSLSLQQASNLNGGEFRCRAENEAGWAESVAKVVVRSVAQEVPEFEKPLVDTTVTQGQQLLLTVRVLGSKPKVTFFRNDRRLDVNSVEQQDNIYSLLIKNAQPTDSGRYKARAVNKYGCVTSEAEVRVRPLQPEVIRPSCPTRVQEQVVRNSSKAVGSKFTTKSEPQRKPFSEELLPFPFQPEKAGHLEKPLRRNPGKVPKPSKFIKGEMYHSDYESDWDLGFKLPAKWRSTSDTEGTGGYRKIRWASQPVRKPVTQPEPERHPSPPCPHQWESHEDIEKLQDSLRSKNDSSSLKTLFSSMLQDVIQSTTASKSTSSSAIRNETATAEYTKPQRSESTPMLSSSLKQYVRVREKVRRLEQRFEDEHNNRSRSETPIRPEEIPGAVRIFPPASPSGSRKGSLDNSRSASVDLTQSCRLTPLLKKFWIKSEEVQSASGVTEEAQREKATFHSSAMSRDLQSDSDMESGSLTLTGLKKKASPKLNRKSAATTCPDPESHQPGLKSGKETGYEADTDDTLQRKSYRKSVKELASEFQRAEDSCPSSVPLRPRGCFTDSDYESDYKNMSFTSSNAYVAPKWASESQFVSKESQSRTETKAARSMIQRDERYQSSCFQSQMTFSSMEERTFRSESSSTKKAFTESHSNHDVCSGTHHAEMQPQDDVCGGHHRQPTGATSPSSPVVFAPSKFVPGKSSDPQPEDKWWTMDTSYHTSTIKPLWSAETNCQVPVYRKVTVDLSRSPEPDSNQAYSDL